MNCLCRRFFTVGAPGLVVSLKIVSVLRNFTSRSVVVVFVSSVDDSAVAINWVYKRLVIALARLCLATSAGDVEANKTSFGSVPVDSAPDTGGMPLYVSTSSCNSSLVSIS